MNLTAFSTFFLIISIFYSDAYAYEACFIAKENDKILIQQGDCDKRVPPFSTFKVPLAVIGFDAGTLQNVDQPMVAVAEAIEKGYYAPDNNKKYPFVFWNKDQAPSSWMHYSAVWYSRYITHKLGMQKLQTYINKFAYGNMDLCGDRDKNNGLMIAWLDSSLKITPLEQVIFFEKLANRKLPVSQAAQENTIKLIKLENLYGDWQLYGKTGGNSKNCWFVGWIEKGKRQIVFAQYLGKLDKMPISGGKVAKEMAKDNLMLLLAS